MAGPRIGFLTVSDLTIHRALSFFAGFDAALVVAAKLAMRSGVASFGGMSIALCGIEELKMKLLSGERESAFVKSLWLHEAPFRWQLCCIYPCVDLWEVQIDWFRLSLYAPLSAPVCKSGSVQRNQAGWRSSASRCLRAFCRLRPRLFISSTSHFKSLCFIPPSRFRALTLFPARRLFGVLVAWPSVGRATEATR